MAEAFFKQDPDDVERAWRTQSWETVDFYLQTPNFLDSLAAYLVGVIQGFGVNFRLASKMATELAEQFSTTERERWKAEYEKEVRAFEESRAHRRIDSESGSGSA